MLIGALGDIHGEFDTARQIMARHPDVPLHDAVNGFELAVNVAQGADLHFSRDWGLGAGGWLGSSG